MNYRFQKFTSLYGAFVRQFLTNNPGNEALSYQQLYDNLARTCYGWSNFFEKHMADLGNAAEDLFASCEPLQKAWAREHGVAYGADSWLADIVLAQVRAFQPDVLFLQDLYLFDAKFRKRLRESLNKRVLMIGWRFAVTTDYSDLKDLDVLVTGNKYFVDTFRNQGVHAELMSLAFEAAILDRIKLPTEKHLGFTFVGNVGSPDGPHSERYAMVDALMKSTPMEIWGESQEPPPRSARGRLQAKMIYQGNRLLNAVGVSDDRRARLPALGQGAGWTIDPTLPSIQRRYPGRTNGQVFGLDYFDVLARSKICFNCHIDVAGNSAGNMRLFEATGVGSCLLTDWKSNLSDFFESDREVVVYRSVEECIEKAGYLLEHEAERSQIARAGQKRTLRDHTYAQRVARLDEIIREALAR